MADVKWIKITTDIFDDEKILLIESLPEADSIIVIWFKLLCLAGKINNSGVFMMNNQMPYTDKMLATIFRRKEATVQLALQTFEQFGMIEIIDGVITIPNWGKHQSLDALEKRRAYQRELMRKKRAEQKLICDANGKANSDANGKANVSSLDKNRIDKNRIDIDKEIESDASSPAPKPKRQSKHTHGKYKNVLLTDDELSKLTSEYGESMTGELIVFLDEYIEMKGYKAKSHYLAIKKWVVDAVNERREKKNRSGTYTLSNGVETSNPFIADIDAIEHEPF